MKTGAGYQFQADLADAATTYVDIDATSVDESMNEVVDTFYKLSDGGFATSVVTALDPEFSLLFKFDESDTTMVSITEKRLKLGTDRNFSLKIIDNATGNTITADAVFTAIGTSRVAESVIEVPVTVKLRGAPSIAPTA